MYSVRHVADNKQHEHYATHYDKVKKTKTRNQKQHQHCNVLVVTAAEC